MPPTKSTVVFIVSPRTIRMSIAQLHLTDTHTAVLRTGDHIVRSAALSGCLGGLVDGFRVFAIAAAIVGFLGGAGSMFCFIVQCESSWMVWAYVQSADCATVPPLFY